MRPFLCAAVSVPAGSLFRPVYRVYNKGKTEKKENSLAPTGCKAVLLAAGEGFELFVPVKMP